MFGAMVRKERCLRPLSLWNPELLKLRVPRHCMPSLQRLEPLVDSDVTAEEMRLPTRRRQQKRPNEIHVSKQGAKELKPRREVGDKRAKDPNSRLAPGGLWKWEMNHQTVPLLKQWPADEPDQPGINPFGWVDNRLRLPHQLFKYFI